MLEKVEAKDAKLEQKEEVKEKKEEKKENVVEIAVKEVVPVKEKT